MEAGRKGREKKTPVKILPKLWKTNATKLLAKIEKARLSEDQPLNPAILRRVEITDRILEMVQADDVITLVEQMKALKVKKTEEIVKRLEALEAVVLEVEKEEPTTPEDALFLLSKALCAGVVT